MVEGEGSFSRSKSREGCKGYARLEVVSTDLDVIQRLVEWSGVGRINGPYQSAGSMGSKPQWRWRVGRREEVAALFKAIAPFLCERRREQMRRRVEGE